MTRLIGFAVLVWLAAAWAVRAQSTGTPGLSPQDAVMIVPRAAPTTGRLAEIRVRLAWLADPVTFPYKLEAEMTDVGLQLWGHVPNAGVHNRAIQLARLHCSGAVADLIKEAPYREAPPRSVPVAELHSAVSAALHSALPQQAPSLRFQCRPDGQVAVAGYV